MKKKHANDSSEQGDTKTNLSRRKFIKRSASVIAAGSVLGASVITREALAQ
ncbi:MAG: twin-arginine translocation signal domain-containing protein, partial [Cyclobacteriaceae bacterium]|nr:twin-arginine translocation signal domain-containing protein [Cyclobacteriaceae bacterium]